MLRYLVHILVVLSLFFVTACGGGGGGSSSSSSEAYSRSGDHDNDGVSDDDDDDDDDDGIRDSEDDDLWDHDNDGIRDDDDDDDDDDGIRDSDDDYLLDHDNDGTRDSLDADDDNDGILDTSDSYPYDHDNDGTRDSLDTDDDDDGILDTSDTYPYDYDNDNSPDDVDTDDDGDSVLDLYDVFPRDRDNDGIKDQDDTNPDDYDNDGIADAVDTYPYDEDNDGDDGLGGNTRTSDLIAGTRQPNFSSWANVTTAQTVTLQGIASTSEYENVPLGGAITAIRLMNVGQIAGATIAIAYDALLDPIAISLDTNNDKGQLFDTNGADIRSAYNTLVPGVQGFSYFENLGLSEVALMATAKANGWDYQTFGAWTHGRDDIFVELGAFSTGLETAETAIPISGTASYTGQVAGVYIDNAGTSDFTVTSDFTASANFATRAVAFASTNSVARDVLTGLVSNNPALNMTGTLNYAVSRNLLEGTLTSTGGLSGTAVGKFYGPAAQEIGGTFTLAAPAPGVEVFKGAFGGQ